MNDEQRGGPGPVGERGVSGPVCDAGPPSPRRGQPLLIAALAKAQSVMTSPARNREVKVRTKSGGTYSFRYATLDHIIEAIRKPLTENGLWFTQVLESDEGGKYRLITRLLHESGESIESRTPLLVENTGSQAFGSALTYMRRYALTALLGIAADEDDDANTADGHTVERSASNGNNGARKPPQAVQATPPADPKTGKPLPPSLIPVEQGKDGQADWIGWGSTLAAALQASTPKQAAAWMTKNKDLLANCAEQAPAIHKRLTDIANDIQNKETS